MMSQSSPVDGGSPGIHPGSTTLSPPNCVNGSLLDSNGTEDNMTSVIELLIANLGDRHKDIRSATALTVVYVIIFLTGVIGNVCTCIVIARNLYMHTATNYYLFSLAVSDLLTLLFALPPELYSIWEAYPWHFGEPFCLFKSYLVEITAYASVLTITSFTVERYVAICHPIRGQRSARQSRALKCIAIIWITSALCALPYPIHTRVFTVLQHPKTHRPIMESLVCNIPVRWRERMAYSFQVSTFVFFIFPMAVITGMYLLIGVRLRNSALAASLTSAQSQPAKTAAARARRAVLKMLVAVVVAFFVCWAPFHAQRLMTQYIPHNSWTPQLIMVQSHLFYVSGVLYFLSSTVNPILYNLLSRKFRQAFKRTLCRCCLDLNATSIPAFYKLKAKFVGNEHTQRTGNNNSCYLYPGNAIRMTDFPDKKAATGGVRKKLPLPYRYGYPSTNETSCKNSSPTQGSISAAHAHSDGRLHRICRHKYCSSRRENNKDTLMVPCRMGCEDGMDLECGGSSSNSRHDMIATSTRRVIISYPDIHYHSNRRFGALPKPKTQGTLSNGEGFHSAVDPCCNSLPTQKKRPMLSW